jgi:hypothetical protein
MIVVFGVLFTLGAAGFTNFGTELAQCTHELRAACL